MKFEFGFFALAAFYTNYSLYSQRVLPLYKNSIPNSKPVFSKDKVHQSNGIICINSICTTPVEVFYASI